MHLKRHNTHTIMFRLGFASAYILALLVSMSVSSIAFAQSQASGPHIKVSLLSEYQQFSQGTNWVGVLFEPDPQWHTYWRNPGDSGEAPTFNWTLPDYAKAGEIEWPIPYEIRVAHLVNYGYEGANLLMVPIHINSGIATSVNISVDVSWLVCKEDCIPGWATLSKQINLAETKSLGENSSLFSATRSHLPKPQHVIAKHETTEQNIVVSLTAPGKGDWRLLALDSGIMQHNAAQNIVASSEEDQISIVLQRSDYFAGSNADISFLLSDGEQAYYLKSSLNSAPINKQEYSLVLLAAMAFAGGLILNLMPCVLPILSIKALSMQSQSTSLFNKSAYLLGVLCSFLGFALLIVLFKQGGNAVGWGFHMQHPWVVALLAFLFTFIALSLMDIIPSTGRFSGIGQSLIQGQSNTSQFMTGVLAVIVASPCTAPFMAAALGVAMVSDAVVTFTVFASLGLGFALPMTLLFLIPSLKRRLPKPGPWMVSFRQFLVFPILATVIWLVWIYMQQTSSLAQLWLLCGLLTFCMLVWFATKSSKYIALTFYLLALGFVGVVAFKPYQSTTPEMASMSVPFSQQRLDQLKDDNQVVLVNMTADWCITCKVNEQVAFSSIQFEQAIQSQNVQYMIGDWTNKNDQILKYLNQYQRSGVPLYVLYSGNKNTRVLPQILTTQSVVEAIAIAKGEIQDEI